MRRRGSQNTGITLLEIMVVVGILALATFLTNIIINVLADLYIQKSYVSGQQEIQSVLYNMAKEVRNSRSIVGISSDTLVLQSFNTENGYKPDQILNVVNIGTITYRFVASETPTYLKRTVERNGIQQEKKLLIKVLRTPDTTNYIFGLFPPNEIQPYEGVSIALHLETGFRKDSNRTYRLDVLKRSHSVQ